MARLNERGLELSFKRYTKGSPAGRWFKIIGGSPKYFGPGSGVSDRKSYDDALTKYQAHIGTLAEAKLVQRLGPVIVRRDRV